MHRQKVVFLLNLSAQVVDTVILLARVFQFRYEGARDQRNDRESNQRHQETIQRMPDGILAAGSEIAVFFHEGCAHQRLIAEVTLC
jgi:hypothetical protein